MNVKIQTLKEQLFQDWEQLHGMPEVGFREFKTSRYLRSRLESMGFYVDPIAGTGLLAKLSGARPGPSVGLRADMDALPFPNKDGTTTVIHACGHDAHCAMVLNAGAIAAREGLEGGTLYLLFQPAEETIEGAQAVLKSGLPHLDALFGMHLRPLEELPYGTATAQLIHQATRPIKVTFRGKSAHAARPHLGINALSAAAAAIVRVDHLKLDTSLSWSAKATVIDCNGNAHNVIPEWCSVTFDLRAETNALGDELSDRILAIAAESAEEVGATMESTEIHGYAPEYDGRLVRICERAIGEVLGSVAPPVHTLGSEDFHAYRMEGGISSAYMGLGAGLTPGLHSREMTFNHECMPFGTEILYHCVRDYLAEN